MINKRDFKKEVKELACSQAEDVHKLNTNSFCDLLHAWCVGPMLLTQTFCDEDLQKGLDNLEQQASEMLDSINSERGTYDKNTIQSTLVACIRVLADITRPTESTRSSKGKRVTLAYNPAQKTVVIDASEDDFIPEFLKYLLEAHGIPDDVTIKFTK